MNMDPLQGARAAMRWSEDSLREQHTLRHADCDFRNSFWTPRRARPELKELQNVPLRVMVLHRSLNPHSKEEEISMMELEDRKIGCQHHLVQEFPLQQHRHQCTRPIPKALRRAGAGEQRERRREGRREQQICLQMTPDRRTQMSQRWCPRPGARSATPKIHLMIPGWSQVMGQR